MAIVPDDKDWTWVLDRPCPGCGFDAADLDPAAAPDVLRESAARWRELLAADGVTDRPDERTWSTLEYGCHTRDVFRVFHERVVLMLSEDDPLFANWDQDETAVQQRYGEQHPAAVADELAAGADALAARLETVTGEQWGRPGRRSSGSTFTVDSLVRYLLHDVVHHVHDVTGRRG